MISQLAYKGSASGITIVRVLGQCFSKRRSYPRMQVAARILDSQRIGGDDLKHHRVCGVAHKWKAAGEHLKRHNSQRKLIRAPIDLFGANLLRRHISRRSETYPCG